MKNAPSLLSWRVWVWSAVFWMLMGSVQVLALEQVYGMGLQIWDGVAGAFVAFGPLALLTPILMDLSDRLVRTARSRRGLWLPLIGLVLSAAALHSLWSGLVPTESWLVWFGASQFSAHVFHYATIAGAAVALAQLRRGEEQKRELVSAQLRALRGQLQPHFLFNTLHAIGVTATSDGPTAARMTTLLGDLLRQTVQERDGNLVSLAAEHELLQPYLALQQLRFADRLHFDLDLPPDVLGAQVPDLLLQPLVENALQHGIEWIEARGNYVHLHHEGGPFLLRETLTSLANTLDPKRFVRVHRSAIIALDEVLEVARLPGGDQELHLRSGAHVPIGRSHRADFERAWIGT